MGRGGAAVSVLDTPLGSPHSSCVAPLMGSAPEPDLSARYRIPAAPPVEATTALDAGRQLACAVAELPLGRAEYRLLVRAEAWAVEDRLALARLIEVARQVGSGGEPR